MRESYVLLLYIYIFRFVLSAAMSKYARLRRLKSIRMALSGGSITSLVLGPASVKPTEFVKVALRLGNYEVGDGFCAYLFGAPDLRY